MNKMEKITDLYESCTTLGGMYNNFDEAVDVTKPEDMDAVIKAAPGFKDMSSITPEMIENFMRGKVEHINAVHNRVEEIEKKKLEEYGERNSGFERKCTTKQNQMHFQPEETCNENNKTGKSVNTDYDEMHTPTWNEYGLSRTDMFRDEPSSVVSEIESLKDEISEIKEMMKLILSKQNKQSPVVFEN